LLVKNENGLDERWIPTASFPRAKEDSFLYLLLGDGKRSLNFRTPFSLHQQNTELTPRPAP
jgi:hypothetical protein